MKWFKWALALCLLKAAFAQSTVVTLQVTDADGQTWNNGTWQVQLVSQPGSSNQGPPFFIAGSTSPVPNQLQSGVLNQLGTATITLTPNASISPALTIWQFVVCPAATSACFSPQQGVVIVGATQNVTLAPPGVRVGSTLLPRAYRDSEVAGFGAPGYMYYNLSDNSIHSYGTTIPNHTDRQPIICNADFEGSSQIPPPCWQARGAETISYETVTQLPGKNQSIKIVTSGISGGIQTANLFSVIPGETYQATVQSKTDGVANSVLAVVFRDKGGNSVGTIQQVFAGTSWTQLTASGAVPANAIQGQVVLEGAAATGTIWFDQPSVQKTGFLTLTINGDQAMTAAPRMMFSAEVVNVNSSGTWGIITLDKPITITRIGFSQNGTVLAGCSVQPNITSGSALFAVANGVGTGDSGALSVNVPAGAFAIGTQAGTGCTGGTGTNYMVTVEYKMQ